MAQPRVSDFFNARKKGSGIQASKRRKVEASVTNISVSELETTNSVKKRVTRSRTQAKPIDLSTADLKEKLNFSNLEDVAFTSVSNKTQTNPKKSRTRSKKKVVCTSKDQSTIEDAFSVVVEKQQNIEETSASDVGKTLKNTNKALLYEDVTSQWDEHAGAEHCTPKKGETNVTRKRTRRGKGNVDQIEEVTPAKTEASLQNPPSSVRKRLTMKHHSDHVSGVDKRDDIECNVLAIAKSLQSPKAISPLPDTPDHVQTTIKNTPSKPTSEGVKAAIEDCKSLNVDKDKCTSSPSKKQKMTEEQIIRKLTPAAVKDQLAKCGKLEELKAQLSKMSELKAKAKKPKAKLKTFDTIEIEVVSPKKAESAKVPAFERFHSLATEIAPTLSLPYKYKLLEEAFRCMDTVVHMLHNRKEICTFSKMKTAVQQMTKRNFEQKNLGQTSTVFPEAYILRQEKGLPCVGGKTTDYQLTIEAKFDAESNDKNQVNSTKNQRQVFTATMLLQRKSDFHRSLVNIVREHHKEFLSKLDSPLSVPDDKLTRWHPKFSLDNVPDIDAAPLPEPPFVKKYQTAYDVLEHTKGKLLPRVTKALQNVAKKLTPTKENKVSEKIKVPEASNKLLNGIPLSLLEKIRAKEAQKQKEAMMRNPAAERRTTMMKRLPDIMRILRAHFITEKKPALPVENVNLKLVENYKSCISSAEVEAHMQLLLKMAPEWITMVQIKKGKYLKIDKGKDLQSVVNKINTNFK